MPSVAILRELFRNLQAFQSVFESEGISTLIGPDGETYCLEDLEWLYQQRFILPTRQREAIELCLVANYRESDAAVMMGVSPVNPVAQYAAEGLAKLLKLLDGQTVDPVREVRIWLKEADLALAKLDLSRYPAMAARLRERIDTLTDVLEILRRSGLKRSNGRGNYVANQVRGASTTGRSGERSHPKVSRRGPQPCSQERHLDLVEGTGPAES